MDPNRTKPSTIKQVQTVIGFLAAWLLTTAIFILGSHIFHLGPGFSFPYPYAAATLTLCIAGHGIQRWVRS